MGRPISALSVIILSALILIFSVLALPTNALVVGGHYQVTAGENLHKNMWFCFTQVVIDENASVDGNIFLFSSTLDSRGVITKNVRAFESDLMLHETGAVDGKIEEKDLFHWTLLLPSVLWLL